MSSRKMKMSAFSCRHNISLWTATTSLAGNFLACFLLHHEDFFGACRKDLLWIAVKDKIILSVCYVFVSVIFFLFGFCNFVVVVVVHLILKKEKKKKRLP
jgi:hypothetical protein